MEKSNSSSRFFGGKAGEPQPPLVALCLHGGDLHAEQPVEEVRVGGLLLLCCLQLACQALRDGVHPERPQMAADALVGGIGLAAHRDAPATSA